jgi:hypothetical protein
MATFLQNLTLSPENIRDLRQLINVDLWRDERLQDYFRVVPARHGDPVGLIGKGNPIGTAGCGCDPEYAKFAPSNTLKRWNLGCWQAPLKVCWKDMEGTIAEYALKNGTPIGDLNGTQVMSEVIEPLLTDLYVDLVWRLAWFGDTAAENISDGGVIVNTLDSSLVNAVDGLWKQIYGSSMQTSRVADVTDSNTKGDVLVAGVPTKLIEQMMVDANAATMALPNKVIYMTMAMATALEWDMRNSGCGCMPWEDRVNGVRTTKWNGIEYIALPKWDEYIDTFEGGSMPYRAVLTNRDNILIGTPSGEFVQDFDLYFDRISRNMFLYGTGKIGAMFVNDSAFHALY